MYSLSTSTISFSSPSPSPLPSPSLLPSPHMKLNLKHRTPSAPIKIKVPITQIKCHTAFEKKVLKSKIKGNTIGFLSRKLLANHLTNTHLDWVKEHQIEISKHDTESATGWSIIHKFEEASKRGMTSFSRPVLHVWSHTTHHSNTMCLRGHIVIQVAKGLVLAAADMLNNPDSERFPSLGVVVGERCIRIYLGKAEEDEKYIHNPNDWDFGGPWMSNAQYKKKAMDDYGK